MTECRVGTCSWTDKTLIEESDFYPPTVKTPAQRLQFYTTHFSTVEVDSSFYAFPAERNALLWVERTPKSFLFNCKAFALFTFHPVALHSLPSFLRAELPSHLQETPSLQASSLPQEFLALSLHVFFQSLRPLQEAKKLGYLLFQFPPWFKKGEREITYLTWLRERAGNFHLAIEFRHRSWLKEENRADTLSLLRSLNCTYVCVDEPQLSWTVPPLIAQTTKSMVVRFHGRNRTAWQNHHTSVHERFAYFYQEEELRPWAQKLASFLGKSERIFLMFNNCYRDYAVRNAQMMQKLLLQ